MSTTYHCDICAARLDALHPATGEVVCSRGHRTELHQAIRLSDQESMPLRPECVNDYCRQLHQAILHGCTGASTMDRGKFEADWLLRTYIPLCKSSIYHLEWFFKNAGYVVAFGETTVVFALDSDFNPLETLYYLES